MKQINGSDIKHRLNVLALSWHDVHVPYLISLWILVALGSHLGKWAIRCLPCYFKYTLMTLKDYL